MKKWFACFSVGFVTMQFTIWHFVRRAFVFFASSKIMLNTFHYFFPFFFFIGFFLLPYPVPFGICSLLSLFTPAWWEKQFHQGLPLTLVNLLMLDDKSSYHQTS